MMSDNSCLLMIIEDDRDIREALTDLLHVEGYHVVAFAHGGEALDYLETGELPRLIFLDLMMPVMDGREFRKRQREDPRLAEIPVVVLSAARGQDPASISADAFVAKPLRLDDLLKLIQRFCGGRAPGGG